MIRDDLPLPICITAHVALRDLNSNGCRPISSPYLWKRVVPRIKEDLSVDADRGGRIDWLWYYRSGVWDPNGVSSRIVAMVIIVWSIESCKPACWLSTIWSDESRSGVVEVDKPLKVIVRACLRIKDTEVVMTDQRYCCSCRMERSKECDAVCDA